MHKVQIAIGSLMLIALISGISWAGFGQREPVKFYVGHTHGEDGSTIGAPHHSGGTDRNGCHNASVPYHCH
jgi:hypothetical protein